MVQIAAGSFEGLFIRALKVSGPIVDRLKAAGFEPDKMQPAYPVEVWRRALQIACLEYYPTLQPAQAEFELGKRMVDGYFETLVGKVLQATMPFLSTETLCKRLPRMFASGVVGEVKQPVAARVGERHYTVQLWGDQGVPWFTAGAVDSVLRKTKAEPTVTVADVKKDSFIIDIKWAAPR